MPTRSSAHSRIRKDAPTWSTPGCFVRPFVSRKKRLLASYAATRPAARSAKPVPALACRRGYRRQPARRLCDWAELRSPQPPSHSSRRPRRQSVAQPSPGVSRPCADSRHPARVSCLDTRVVEIDDVVQPVARRCSSSSRPEAGASRHRHRRNHRLSSSFWLPRRSISLTARSPPKQLRCHQTGAGLVHLFARRSLCNPAACGRRGADRRADSAGESRRKS